MPREITPRNLANIQPKGSIPDRPITSRRSSVHATGEKGRRAKIGRTDGNARETIVNCEEFIHVLMGKIKGTSLEDDSDIKEQFQQHQKDCIYQYPERDISLKGNNSSADGVEYFLRRTASKISSPEMSRTASSVQLNKQIPESPEHPMEVDDFHAEFAPASPTTIDNLFHSFDAMQTPGFMQEDLLRTDHQLQLFEFPTTPEPSAPHLQYGQAPTARLAPQENKYISPEEIFRRTNTQ